MGEAVIRAAVLLALLAMPAGAQTLEEGRAWIHVNGRQCCPHDNCFPAPGATLTAEGWHVPGLPGRLHPFAARLWPFAQTWACYYKNDPSRKLMCIFAPPPEAS